MTTLVVIVAATALSWLFWRGVAWVAERTYARMYGQRDREQAAPYITSHELRPQPDGSYRWERIKDDAAKHGTPSTRFAEAQAVALADQWKREHRKDTG